MYLYLTRFESVAFCAKLFYTYAKGPSPCCLPQGPHHPRSTPGRDTCTIAHVSSFINHVRIKHIVPIIKLYNYIHQRLCSAKNLLANWANNLKNTYLKAKIVTQYKKGRYECVIPKQKQ